MSPPTELPPHVGEFIGRRRDLESLRTLVGRSGVRCMSAPVIVTIYGQPGTGTSTLAVRFAHEIRARYPDALLYVDLDGASGAPLDPLAALCHLMRGQGARSVELPPDLERLVQRYRASLHGRRAIVVLDNAASEAQVRPLLPTGPGCLVLITSRHPLAGLPCSSQHRLGLMSEKESIALLAAVGGAGVRRRRNVDEARRLVSLCAYLPLAISVAGVVLRCAPDLPLVHLRSRLDEMRLTELSSGNPDVAASFEVSYEQLSPPQRTLFRRLRLLPEPSFGPGVAAALLDAELSEARETLNGLVERQLLRRIGDDRFGFHGLLGHFANERLQREEAAPDRQLAHERALRFYLDQAARRTALLDPSILELDHAGAFAPPATLDQQAEALEWLERERPTLVMAARQAAQVQAHDVTWRLAATLLPFLEVRGHRTVWAEARSAALTAARATGRLSALAWTHLGAGHSDGLAGRWNQALCHLEEALEMARAGGWPRVQARALYLMGRVEHDRGELEAALWRYDRAAAIFHDEDMCREQASTVLSIAAALHEQNLIATEDLIDMGRSVIRGLEQIPEELWIVRTIGRINEYLGRAHSYACSSRDAFGRIGFRHGQGRALRDLGRIWIEQRDLPGASQVLDESTALFRTTGDRDSEAEALQLAGTALYRLGMRAEADVRMQDARAAVPTIAPRTVDPL